MTVLTGLERLLDGSFPEADQLKKRNIGMITNHTSVTKQFQPGVEELLKWQYGIKKIFGPEHGFRGNAGAGDKVGHEVDDRTGLPVYSLYETRKPTEEMMEGLDAFLFDMQDIGVRYYTYIYTMAYAMEAAAESGLDFYVIDRPNPLTGIKTEGNVLDIRFRCFSYAKAG